MIMLDLSWFKVVFIREPYQIQGFGRRFQVFYRTQLRDPRICGIYLNGRDIVELPKYHW